jgi:hypothetical protein
VHFDNEEEANNATEHFPYMVLPENGEPVHTYCAYLKIPLFHLQVLIDLSYGELGVNYDIDRSRPPDANRLSVKLGTLALFLFQ